MCAISPSSMVPPKTYYSSMQGRKQEVVDISSRAQIYCQCWEVCAITFKFSFHPATTSLTTSRRKPLCVPLNIFAGSWQNYTVLGMAAWEFLVSSTGEKILPFGPALCLDIAIPTSDVSHLCSWWYQRNWRGHSARICSILYQSTSLPARKKPRAGRSHKRRISHSEPDERCTISTVRRFAAT